MTPVGNVRPPKASGGRPLCPKKPGGGYGAVVCDAVQKKRTSISIIAISKSLHGNTRHKGWCIMREKKLETVQASRHRASGGSPSGRPTGIL